MLAGQSNKSSFCFVLSQQGWNFQEKTSNWEGDPPGELTVPQTDTGGQVENTKALERTRVKELGKMVP